MRASSWLCGLLVFLPASTPAAPDHMQCFAHPRPADCFARLGAETSGVSADSLLDAVLRHGLVDLVPRDSRKLLRTLPRSFGQLDDPEPTPASLFDLSAVRALHLATREQKLAAIALLSAARYEQDPFSDPVVIKLLARAGNHPIIPALALALWVHKLGMGQDWMESVSVAGMPAIWERTATLKEQAPELVRDVAGSLAFLGKLKPQTQEFFAWYAQHPGDGASQKAAAASQLARYFGMADAAERLMREGGDAATNYNTGGIHRQIALARLSQGYDAEAARVVAADLLESTAGNDGEVSVLDEWIFALLGRSGASRELRQLGDEFSKRGAVLEPASEAAAWFASASECYRASGDLEQARVMARRGLPHVRALVEQALQADSTVDRARPADMARKAHGRGTDAVVALYRAGAVDEAVNTGFLTGSKRYQYAEMAGEAPDPQWAIDDDSWHGRFHLLQRMQRSEDQVRQRQAYDALVRSCGTLLSRCEHDTLKSIALVAAAMGDETRMREAYAAIASGFAGQRGKSWEAIHLGANWAHAEELLRQR